MPTAHSELRLDVSVCEIEYVRHVALRKRFGSLKSYKCASTELLAFSYLAGADTL